MRYLLPIGRSYSLEVPLIDDCWSYRLLVQTKKECETVGRSDKSMNTLVAKPAVPRSRAAPRRMEPYRARCKRSGGGGCPATSRRR
jgi:hypothetical protein